ncbi:MAG: RusA family crossover junction endodeoxyribonuclease [Chloroflexota bacterium]
MKRIEAVIYVEPVGKGRPKFRAQGKHVMAYTPAKTRHTEAMIETAIREQVMAFGRFDPGVPLSISATFFRPRPTHLPKRVKMPVSRPDLDNYAKLLQDALEKYVYPNDSQLTTMKYRKRFGTPPRIELVIQEEVE